MGTQLSGPGSNPARWEKSPLPQPGPPSADGFAKVSAADVPMRVDEQSERDRDEEHEGGVLGERGHVCTRARLGSCCRRVPRVSTSRPASQQCGGFRSPHRPVSPRQ